MISVNFHNVFKIGTVQVHKCNVVDKSGYISIRLSNSDYVYGDKPREGIQSQEISLFFENVNTGPDELAHKIREAISKYRDKEA